MLETGADRWRQEIEAEHLVTLIRCLDKVLNGGLKSGIVEVCGLPGSGRTLFALQICTSSRLPTILGGFDAHSIYIDTSSRFSPTLLRDIASSFKSHLSNISGTNHHLGSNWEDRVMKGVHYIDAFGIIKFVAAINKIEDYIEQNPKIRTIIIDDIAFPFKTDFSNTDRMGILYQIITKLRRLSLKKNLVVIIVNEMSTRIGLGVVGALGDAWAHCIGTRLLMSPPYIVVSHSSEIPDSVVKVKVTRNGIREE